MAEDPYAALGVAKGATAEEIRAVYRKLAKQYHPDLNPGDKTAENRFKAIGAANEILSNPEKRGRFDRGEIGGDGQPRGPDPRHHDEAQRRYRDYADHRGGERYGQAHGDQARGNWQSGFGPDANPDLGDIFGDMFAASGRAQGPRRGRDQRYALQVGFLDAVNGVTRRLALPDGRNLEVKVPAGLEGGQVLRLRGQGEAGLQGGAAGDALIEIEVTAHPMFRREGNTIHLDLPVSLREAVLGGKINVPTPGGAVAMAIPPRSDTGSQLRLRGRGVPAHAGQPAGDLHVTLRVHVAETDAALEAFLQGWAPAAPVDVRRDLPGAAQGGAA